MSNYTAGRVHIAMVEGTDFLGATRAERDSHGTYTVAIRRDGKTTRIKSLKTFVEADAFAQEIRPNGRTGAQVKIFGGTKLNGRSLRTYLCGGTR